MIDRRRLVPLIALLAAACSSPAEDSAESSGGEDQQLNEAAAMLDANSIDANAVTDAAPQTNEAS